VGWNRNPGGRFGRCKPADKPVLSMTYTNPSSVVFQSSKGLSEMERERERGFREIANEMRTEKYY